MTVQHLRSLLESDRVSQLFFEIEAELSRDNAADGFWDAFREGRMTALAKSDDDVHDIADGDVFRRLMTRTITQEIDETVQSVTAPFQYASKLRADSECVSHILHILVESDVHVTLYSIDDIGAFDLILRNAMLQKLKEMDR